MYAIRSYYDFVYGRLRPSDLLQWAARIRTGRDALGAWRVWESSYGYPMMNEAGYAMRRDSRTRNRNNFV